MPLDESKNVTEKNTKATERQIQSVQRAINILNCFTMTNSDAGTDQQSAQFEQRHSPWNSEYALPEWIYQPEWKWAVHAGGGAV